MDRQHSERCDSEELNPLLRHCINNPLYHNTPHTPDSEVLQYLRSKNQELLNINKKWAEDYSTLKQHFEHKVTELKRTLKGYEQRKEEKKKENVDFSFHTMDTTERGQEAELRARLLHADRDIKWLRLHCDTLTIRGQQQDEEIRRLNKVLQKSLAAQHERNQTEENIWKHQARLYEEDFIKERKDRDKLKAKYIELQKGFKKIHDELHAYKLQVQWAPTGPSKGPPTHTQPM